MGKYGTKEGIRQGRELGLKFKELSQKAQNKLEKAMVKGALMVEREAKKRCPFDTGRLRASISHRLVKKSGGEMVAEVGTNVEYAKFVEFGTGVRGRTSYIAPPEGVNLKYTESWNGMPAKPFLYPAYRLNKEEIKKMLAEALVDAMKEVFR